MTIVDHSMKTKTDVSFKEFSTESKEVYVYTPDRYGYDGLNFMFLTLLSDPKNRQSKVTYTAVEYLITVPENSKIKKELIDEYTLGGAEAMLNLLKKKLISADFTGKQKYYTSTQVFVNDSDLWKKKTGLQFRIIVNIHDVENLGSAADFYEMFIDPLGELFDLPLSGE